MKQIEVLSFGLELDYCGHAKIYDTGKQGRRHIYRYRHGTGRVAGRRGGASSPYVPALRTTRGGKEGDEGGDAAGKRSCMVPPPERPRPSIDRCNYCNAGTHRPAPAPAPARPTTAPRARR